MTNPDLSIYIPGLFLLILFGIIASAIRAAQRHARLRDYRFPPGLVRKLRKQYPQYSPLQWHQVLEGLRDWFRLAQLAKSRPLSMPSQAVDVVWHEFILFTRDYDAFCRAVLGRYLHHVPAESMRTPLQAHDGLRRAWRLACVIETLDRKRPSRLPRLFRLDAELAFPDGFAYAIDCLAQPQRDAYCATHMGCASGCGAGCGDSGGDGGGCGGD
jgi:hypothetical protein